MLLYTVPSVSCHSFHRLSKRCSVWADHVLFTQLQWPQLCPRACGWCCPVRPDPLLADPELYYTPIFQSGLENRHALMATAWDRNTLEMKYLFLQISLNYGKQIMPSGFLDGEISIKGSLVLMKLKKKKWRHIMCEVEILFTLRTDPHLRIHIHTCTKLLQSQDISHFILYASGLYEIYYLTHALLSVFTWLSDYCALCDCHISVMPNTTLWLTCSLGGDAGLVITAASLHLQLCRFLMVSTSNASLLGCSMWHTTAIINPAVPNTTKATPPSK